MTQSLEDTQQNETQHSNDSQQTDRQHNGIKA